ncbi:MAG: M23 family metallopeptidase [Burkholderiales bacterium]|nr:M23 family metallopeptidase [Burkholderiales bacterium]
MNIILVSGRLAKTRTITISRFQIAMIAGLLALSIPAAIGFIYYSLPSSTFDLNQPRMLLGHTPPGANARAQSHLRENLSAMATKVGQMQARLLRLDSLGERLAKAAGIEPQDVQLGGNPGRGGALSSIPQQDFSIEELNAQLDTLARQVDERYETLGMIESITQMEQVKRKLVPSAKPVAGAWHSSSFGWRVDPFTGRKAMHEGIDFVASAGTPIFAAAGGMVVYAGRHLQYGNMVDISHGNHLVSRYAHASRLLVKVGDIVQSGARIAEVGSTGRSTGAHLHFEVHLKGVPQNPARFLQMPG